MISCWHSSGGVIPGSIRSPSGINPGSFPGLRGHSGVIMGSYRAIPGFAVWIQRRFGAGSAPAQIRSPRQTPQWQIEPSSKTLLGKLRFSRNVGICSWSAVSRRRSAGAGIKSPHRPTRPSRNASNLPKRIHHAEGVFQYLLPMCSYGESRCCIADGFNKKHETILVPMHFLEKSAH